MKDLTKYYIDLSKCSEEQRKHIISLLPESEYDHQYLIQPDNFILHFLQSTWWVFNYGSKNKTELTYPEFIKLFEDGEEEKEIENIKDIAHTEGVLVGLKICKELWAQGTISHETIQEEIYHYQEELDNLNSK